MNVFLSGLLPALAGQGVYTDVLTRGFGRSVSVTHPSPGVRVFHLPCAWEPGAPTREGALRALPRFVSSARILLGGRLRGYGAVSAHYWMSGLAAREVCQSREKGRIPPAPLAFSFHTVEARKIRLPGTVPDGLAFTRVAAERMLAGSVDALVCLSGYDLAETVRWNPAAAPRGVVIPPGIDERFLHPPGREAARGALGIHPTGTLFLLAARADSGKNVEAALGAVGRLRSRGIDVSMVVLGQEREGGGDACDGVVFAGPVPHARMPAYYAAADAVVCPSLYESFGLVPLESLAAGTPILAPETVFWGSRVAAYGGGLAYAPSDPFSLEHAMARLASDGPLRERLSAGCGRLAAPFTWSRCAASWASLLSRLPSHGGRPGTLRVRAAPRRR